MTRISFLSQSIWRSLEKLGEPSVHPALKVNPGGPAKKSQKENVIPAGSSGITGVSHGNPGYYNSPHSVGGVNVALLSRNLSDSKTDKWLM